MCDVATFFLARS